MNIAAVDKVGFSCLLQVGSNVPLYVTDGNPVFPQDQGGG